MQDCRCGEAPLDPVVNVRICLHPPPVVESVTIVLGRPDSQRVEQHANLSLFLAQLLIGPLRGSRGCPPILLWWVMSKIPVLSFNFFGTERVDAPAWKL